ncbi:hypothetical protein Acry_3344 (plasmid) [Acidiphilium cryptum JF-5]|uniref:Uncharacterized protein n=1 Tax=Acidiphilium cryptum (strain JF-5) TaxID=349163 RepID=A5FTM4_ACICJ|nr:hypothetical protein Acry_3344 [Acidiphilium cryptum JF-5]
MPPGPLAYRLDRRELRLITPLSCHVLNRAKPVGQDRIGGDCLGLLSETYVEVDPGCLGRLLQPLPLNAYTVGHGEQLIERVRPHVAHDHAAERVADIVNENGYSGVPQAPPWKLASERICQITKTVSLIQYK